MFEDSLVESTGRIRTHSQRYAVGSFAVEMFLLAVLALVPYFYPAALPKQFLTALLAAPPPPPAASTSTMRAASAHAINPARLSGLSAPAIIPRQIAEDSDQSDAPQLINLGMEHQGLGITGAITLPGNPPPIPRVVVRPKLGGPVRVSAGVAEGHLLTPIQPVYPPIARTARIQGTVVIDAVISTAGIVEQVHAVSGPPMLVQAALSAVERARYQPYQLNDQPVEVATTINIVFTLDN